MPPTDLSENLFDFAYIPDFEQEIIYLAEKLADHETWKFENITPTDDTFSDSSTKKYPILTSYINHTYKRIAKEKKVLISDDGKYSCWNTGLLTCHDEPILVLFGFNKQGQKQVWRFSKFLPSSERELIVFAEKRPEMCNYLENPSDLVYDTSKGIVIDFDHIVGDNFQRFPSELCKLGEHLIRNTLRGAIETMKEKVKRNYKIAVPQYFNGSIQLLLPLYFLNDRKPDVALVLEKFSNVYRANTILPLDWAYNNARLIARPSKDWLLP
jgi:hypothetical protein